jgi:Lrp/AsnC family leucine-responsive transcriptional regulator
MKQLNQSEKKVLTLLEQDCRLSANQIAKKTRLSPEGVLKIIKRLEKENIISRFNAKINYSRMGYQLYPVHIQLSSRNKQAIDDIKEKISKHKTCAWYKFCEGEYDLLLSFRILSEEDKIDMDALINEIADYTASKEVSLVLHSFEISKSFAGETSNKLFATVDHSLGKIELSAEEMKIIDILRKNSRETVLTIAEKVKLSPRVVSSRIKKLQKDKVITGFKTKINTSVLEYQPCIALVSLGKYQDLKGFIGYCKFKEGINYLVRQIGKYDLELTIDAPSVNDFYKLMDEIREKFPFIRKITTLIAKEGS